MRIRSAFSAFAAATMVALLGAVAPIQAHHSFSAVYDGNKPVTLRFTRTVERTCATEVAFEHDGKRELVELPLDKPVNLTITFKTAGRITYACGMNMFKGTIVVR